MSTNLKCKFVLFVPVLIGTLCFFIFPAVAGEKMPAETQKHYCSDCAVKANDGITSPCPFCGRSRGKDNRCSNCDDPKKWNE